MTFSSKVLILLLSLLSYVTMATAQEGTVTGTVIDALGEPMIGVTVQVEGTSIGTVTDFEGNYTLRVPRPDANIVFSFVGYDSQIIPLANRNRIDVTMAENVTLMDELIVIGYGTVTKRSLSTAVATVEGDKVADMPTGNLAQRLVGLSSGVTFQQISG